MEAREAQDGPDGEETYHALDHARRRLLHRVQKLTVVFGHCGNGRNESETTTDKPETTGGTGLETDDRLWSLRKR